VASHDVVSEPWKEGDSLLSTAAFLFAVDLGIGALAYLAAWILRMQVRLPLVQDLLPQERWDAVVHPWILLPLSQAFLIYVFGLYDDLRLTRSRELIGQILIACFLQVLAITSSFYLTNEAFPRTVIVLFGGFNLVGLVIWRFYVRARLQDGVRRVLVVSDTVSAAIKLVEEINHNPEAGIEVVGIAAGSSEVETLPPRIRLLGPVSECSEIVTSHQVDEIIFASQRSWKDEVLNSLSQMQAERPLRIAILPSVYEIVIGRLRHINLQDSPLIEVRRNPREPFARFMKRAFDVVVSSVSLVLLSPLFLVVSILILATSRGPVFYKQNRVGLAGREFRLIKFRTMVRDAEKNGEQLAERGDPRVTSVGVLLRRFRLDELPQLINVLMGNMSLVGPRPERPQFARDFSESVPGYNERHKVKPGISGLAQVRGYYHTAAENKLKYDLAYIYNYSFSLDLMIILETFKVILRGRGS
jgi:exopolysaccharide biosynthesis polyprenyl glycosylphosphotransferase